jgi:predicted nucleic acid-binding Zn ribbon protein
MSATPAKECPECGGSVHRVISPVGVIFKGSGFYVTDNRKSSSSTTRNAHKSDEGSDTDKGSTESKVTETSTKKTESTKTNKTKSSSDSD